MKIILGLWLLTTLASGQTARSARTITIGNVELSLGMSKSRVITALSKEFSVENSGELADGAEFWNVNSKGSPEPIGSLMFRKDTLVDATKQWDSIVANQEILRFMKNLYGAVEGATRDTKLGRVSCRVARDPGDTRHYIFLYLGNRMLSLALNEHSNSGKSYSIVTVNESLSQ